jgi:hypothetical protein
MSKYSSKDVGFFLLGGFSILGAVSTIEDTVELKLNETPALGEADESYWSSGARKTTVTQDGWFDDSAGSIHDAFVGLSSVALPMSIAPHGNTKGLQMDCYQSVQRVNYTVQTAVGDVSKAKGEYGVWYGKKPMTIVHALSTETTAGNTDATYVDLGATGGGTNGGAFAVHITALTGCTNATLSLRHCATSGGSYQAISPTATAVLPASVPGGADAGQYVTFTGTINRYVSVGWAYSVPSSPSITFALGVYVAPAA